MFGWEIITVAFLALSLALGTADWLEKRQFNSAVLVVLAFGLIASVYAVLAGIHLLGGWEDPLASTDPETVRKAAARRRAGIVVLAMRYWPYVLIGMGCLGTFGYLRQLWHRR